VTGVAKDGARGSGRLVKAAGRMASMMWSASLGWTLAVSVAVIGLGWFSRTWANRTSYESMDWIALFPGGWGAHSPTDMATSAVVAAIFLAGSAAALCWRGTTSVWMLVLLTGVLSTAYFAYAKTGLTTFTTLVLNGYLRSEQLPIAAAAWALAASAAIAATACAVLRGRRRHRPGLRPLMVGAALGVVAAVVATGAAWRAGDDHRFTDATTAAPARVPSVPNVSGQRRFHLKVADDSHQDADDVYPVRVVAGGTGFLALHAGTVTAYDHDGTQRWHYRRTGQTGLSVQWFDVYGSTVILKLGPGQTIPVTGDTVIGLDAVTGRQLWESAHLVEPQVVARWPGPISVSWHLVAGGDGGTVFLLFDPATGRQTHVVHLPDNCTGTPTDTRTRLVIVADCNKDFPVDVRLITVDPQTGAIIANQHLLDIAANPGKEVIEVTPAGVNGLQLHAGGIPEAPPAPIYFNAATSRLVAEPADNSSATVASRDPGGNFLVLRADPGTTTGMATVLYGSDGVQRCVLASGTIMQDQSRLGPPPAWLGAQVLVELELELSVTVSPADSG
jgi:hypothetical protein